MVPWATIVLHPCYQIWQLYLPELMNSKTRPIQDLKGEKKNIQIFFGPRKKCLRKVIFLKSIYSYITSSVIRLKSFTELLIASITLFSNHIVQKLMNSYILFSYMFIIIYNVAGYLYFWKGFSVKVWIWLLLDIFPWNRIASI